MTDTYVSDIGARLGDDPEQIAVSYGADGDRPVLYLGRSVTIHVSKASPAALERLADLATELAEYRRQQLAGGAS